MEASVKDMLLGLRTVLRVQRLCVIVALINQSLIRSDAQEQPNPVKCEINGCHDDNFGYAAVEMWNRQGNQAKGVLCLVLHPSGTEATVLAEPRPWTILAAKFHCALVTISFSLPDDPGKDWCKASEGTGKAFAEAIDELSTKTKAPRLRTIPVIAVGVCAAGQFAVHLAAFAPERIAGFVTIGGGRHDLSEVGKLKRIKGVVVVTPDRPLEDQKNIYDFYTLGRQAGAPWELEIGNISEYDRGRFSRYGIDLISRMLASQSILSSRPRVSDDTANNWLEMSICGKHIRHPAKVEPAFINLGTIDILGHNVGFNVLLHSTADEKIKSIMLVLRDKRISWNIRSLGGREWILRCQIDNSQLAIGHTKLHLPLQFFDNDGVILGEENVDVNWNAVGECVLDPSPISMGLIQSGESRDLLIGIRSRVGIPIQTRNWTSDVPWITFKTNESDESIHCLISPPSSLKGKGFSGYIQGEEVSPDPRRIRELYFGIVR